MTTTRLHLCCLLLLALLAPILARAGERVDELYRTPFGAVHRTQVDETDGSVWTLAGANVLHLASDGTLLSTHSPGVINANQLLRHPTNGSYWVSGVGSGTVARLSADGRLLFRTTGLDNREDLYLMHLNPDDNSVTVFERSYGYPLRAVHLNASGAVQWSVPVRAAAADATAAVDMADGSLWVISSKAIKHYRADGYLLWQGEGVPEPISVVVNPTDHSFWYTFSSGAIHLAATGAELGRHDAYQYSCALMLDPRDGTVWATDRVYTTSWQMVAVHLAPDGTVLGSYTNLQDPRYAFVSDVPPDSAWLTDRPSSTQSAVVHLASDGSELWRAADFHQARIVAVNPAEGSAWLAEEGQPSTGHPDWVPSLRRITADGQEAFRIIAIGTYDLGVDPRDDSFWFGGDVYASVPDNCPDAWSYHVTPTHVSATGEVLWQHREIWLSSMAGNAQAGACWVGDQHTNEVVSVSPEGAEQWRWAAPPPDGSPRLLRVHSADSPDGSGWVTTGPDGPDAGAEDILYHLAEDGTELWSVPGLHAVWQVAGDRSDGSCWVLERCDLHGVSRLRRFAADGTQLWTLDPFPAYCIAVNPADGSAWVPFQDHLTHVSRDGIVLGTFAAARLLSGSLAVNPLDGSVWVCAAHPYNCLLHYSQEGELLSQTGRLLENADAHLAVDASDGSVWVSDMGTYSATYSQFPTSVSSKILHLSPDGTELWRGTNFNHPTDIWVHPADHTVWVNDLYNNQLVYLGVVNSPFLDVDADYWAFDYIRACVNAGIVGGYPDGTYHPAAPVTRDQMAVFISRALAGGDANVPTGPSTATFPDVLTDHWAFRYVEYAVSHGVTGGYPDGTYRPTLTVTRDQMAVFVARAIAGGDSGVPPGPSTATFPDVPTSQWAFKYIEYITSEGVTGGYDDGTYRPLVAVTRDQMAVFVQRAFDLPM